MESLFIDTPRIRAYLRPMPKFKVEAQSKYSPEETFQKIKGLLENDKELRKMDNYTCQFNEQKMTGSAKGGKFEANMTVMPKNGSCAVEIDVNLPLMLTPVKGLVQSTLQKKLDTLLA